tara:strand:+ start:25 stop:726 length:702 start_codon:yes stop_codon:yes gene_type:complete
MPPTGAHFNAYFDENFATSATPANGLALVDYSPSYFDVCLTRRTLFFNLVSLFIGRWAEEFCMSSNSAPKVGVIMGSKSDWPVMEHAVSMLERLGVAYETRVVSAHRTPDLLFDYAKSAAERGLQVIVAGAGGAAHLPGMVASQTPLPVLGVPVESKALKGLDSLLSIAQMPGGIAVGTLAIGKAGATNAGLLAAQIVGLQDATVRSAVEAFRAEQTQKVLDNPDPRPEPEAE